jgi:hypothetical protein
MIIMPMTGFATIHDMGIDSGKSYTDEENARVRTAAKKVLAEKFDGNKTAMARALKVSQPTISNLINDEDAGVGPGLALKIALATGTTREALLAGKADPTITYDAGSKPGLGQTVLGQLDGFEKTWDEMVRKYARLVDVELREFVAQTSGSWGVGGKVELTPEFLKAVHDSVALARAQAKPTPDEGGGTGKGVGKKGRGK